ncbi:hypothetical protein BKA62DRAFT_684983 [Auriculariales sp. MPI-PUGE-AT-0066]|nr:hypothetical protein BKA62DRAFT_684983 [Auriculariales sp. MPI-PUGE-AT-0066]
MRRASQYVKLEDSFDVLARLSEKTGDLQFARGSLDCVFPRLTVTDSDAAAPFTPSPFQTVALVPVYCALEGLPASAGSLLLTIERKRRNGHLYLAGLRDGFGSLCRIPLTPLSPLKHPDVQRRFPRPVGHYMSVVVAEAYFFAADIYCGPPPPCTSADCMLNDHIRTASMRRLEEPQCECPGRPFSIGLLWHRPDEDEPGEPSLHVYCPRNLEQITKINISPRLLRTSDTWLDGFVRTKRRSQLGTLHSSDRTSVNTWISSATIVRFCLAPLKSIGFRG